MKSIALLLLVFSSFFGFVTATTYKKKGLRESRAEQFAFEKKVNACIVEIDSINKKINYELDSTRTDNWCH